VYELNIGEREQTTWLQLAIVQDKPLRLLVTQVTQIQIWEEQQKIFEWKAPNNISILYACYGATKENIFAILSNKLCCIFSQNLSMICQVDVKNTPSTMAAHPTLPKQIALGNEDGSIQVLELAL